uniref:Golgi associated RAB2 interactor protein-like Rab2B-binding domain-containing protein n=1 Tax=Laticauda laticaudata TaxID=8630 RepID=A0A8C5SGN2_LATLA
MLRSRLPSVSVEGDYGKDLFGREMGLLQEQLHHGEYDLLKFAPMLESDFVQVCLTMMLIARGLTIIVSVACTSPSMLVPMYLLLAPVNMNKLSTIFHAPFLSPYLTGFFPLCLVRISIHNPEKQQLRFKLASGRTFYLQLCSQPGTQEDLFGLWVKVVNMLRPPLDLSIKSHHKTKHETSRSKVYCLSIANFGRNIKSCFRRSLSHTNSGLLYGLESIPKMMHK